MAYDWYDNVPTRATTITARFSSRRTDGEPEVLTGDLLPALNMFCSQVPNALIYRGPDAKELSRNKLCI